MLFICKKIYIHMKKIFRENPIIFMDLNPSWLCAFFLETLWHIWFKMKPLNFSFWNNRLHLQTDMTSWLTKTNKQTNQKRISYSNTPKQLSLDGKKMFPAHHNGQVFFSWGGHGQKQTRTHNSAVLVISWSSFIFQFSHSAEESIIHPNLLIIP